MHPDANREWGAVDSSDPEQAFPPGLHAIWASVCAAFARALLLAFVQPYDTEAKDRSASVSPGACMGRYRAIAATGPTGRRQEGFRVRWEFRTVCKQEIRHAKECQLLTRNLAKRVRTASRCQASEWHRSRACVGLQRALLTPTSGQVPQNKPRRLNPPSSSLRQRSRGFDQ